MGRKSSAIVPNVFKRMGMRKRICIVSVHGRQCTMWQVDMVLECETLRPSIDNSIDRTYGERCFDSGDQPLSAGKSFGVAAFSSIKITIHVVRDSIIVTLFTDELSWLPSLKTGFMNYCGKKLVDK